MTVMTPTEPPRPRGRLSAVGEAVLLLAFQTAVNLPHLASDVLPVHDTLAVY